MSPELSKLFFFAVSRVRPELLQHLDTVSWLTDGRDSSRRSGRSMMMALAYLKHAIENPNIAVDLIDHIGKEGIAIIRQYISGWLTESGVNVAYRFPSNGRFEIADTRGGVPIGWSTITSVKGNTLQHAMKELLTSGHSYAEIKQALDNAVLNFVHSE